MSGLCPDSGQCHHHCAQRYNGACWRVFNASPLSAVGWDEWPEHIVAIHRFRLGTRPDLTFERLRAMNAMRVTRWHGDDDGWTLADWSNAMCGEAGEAANVVKKIRRTESVLWDKQKYPGDGASAHAKLAEMPAEEAREALIENLANELADIICYADLLAHFAGIDLGEAVRAKFNRVSEAQGFPERL